jgi:hypothetical protein
MKTAIVFKSALYRSLKLWKGVLIIWFSSLLLTGMVAIPVKAAFKTAFGQSMITEKLSEGYNIEVFADLGSALKSMTSFFSAGLLMIIFSAFLLNSFFSGGLFDRLKESSGKFNAGEFFSASSGNFWSFLVISLIISMIVLLISLFILILPLSIAAQGENYPEGIMIKTALIVFTVFFLLLTFLLLVADYARAWQVTRNGNQCFKAIGFGFAQTFRTFLSSYPMMITVLIVQFLFGWFVLEVLPGMKPSTGESVFLFFLLSQFLFFLKLFLKVWRYGCVTSLMEMNKSAIIDATPDQQPGLNDTVNNGITQSFTE